MNYRCKELERLINNYEGTNDVNELINGMKRHISEYGKIYDVAGISKNDFEEQGYNVAHVDDGMLEKIAYKIDIGETLCFAIDFWAEHYGIPKMEEVINQ